jgi:hypothetical protein
MKKILRSIILLVLLIGGNAYAMIHFLPLGTTVNQLLKDDYKLINVNSVSSTDEDGYGDVSIYYHLIKTNELVTCVAKIENENVICWIP